MSARPCFGVIKRFGWSEQRSHAGEDVKKDIVVPGFETDVGEMYDRGEVTFHH